MAIHGLEKLDELAQGLRPKKVTVIAGLPGSGKTTLALQIAQHNAVKERKPWLVFSIEMPGEELGLRAIASLGGVALHKLDNPAQMREDDWARMSGAVGLALEAPLFVCDDRCRRRPPFAPRLGSASASTGWPASWSTT